MHSFSQRSIVPDAGSHTVPDNCAMLDDSSYWTRQHRELAQWFDDRAPSFTEAYKAAVVLLHTPRFPGRVHLICHVVRDIYRCLPTALGVKALSRRSEAYPQMVESLADRWKKFPPTERKSSDLNGPDVLVSSQVHGAVRQLVEKSAELKDQPSVGKQLASVLFRSLDRRANDYIDPWIITAFDSEYDFFMGRAHLRTKPAHMPTDDGLLAHFEAFERAFHSLIGPYFSGKEELDAILQDTNPRTD